MTNVRNTAQKPISTSIRSFYETYPYPSQRVGSAKNLLMGGHAHVMKKILATAGLRAEELRGMRVLDAGCGTGEKSLYCALLGAKVDAFDISKTSIEIAKRNAARLGAEDVEYRAAVKDVKYRVADFADVVLRGKYDLVLAMGSLHHSDDPQGNFMRLGRALKEDGHIAIGLYNLYGRLGCRIRRKMMRLKADSPEEIVKRLPPTSNPTHLASLADRYATPHESYHTVEEVLKWFGEAEIEAVGAYPEVNLASRADPLLKQLGWMVREKGFFYMGGKKKINL